MSEQTMVEIAKVVIPLLIGGSIGGLIGFRIGVNTSVKQTQMAKDSAEQVQIGVVKHG